MRIKQISHYAKAGSLIIILPCVLSDSNQPLDIFFAFSNMFSFVSIVVISFHAAKLRIIFDMTK